MAAASPADTTSVAMYGEVPHPTGGHCAMCYALFSVRWVPKAEVQDWLLPDLSQSPYLCWQCWAKEALLESEANVSCSRTTEGLGLSLLMSGSSSPIDMGQPAGGRAQAVDFKSPAVAPPRAGHKRTASNTEKRGSAQNGNSSDKCPACNTRDGVFMYFGLQCKTCKPCYQLWSHHTKFSKLHGETITDHIAKCVKNEQSRQRLRFFLNAVGDANQQKPKEQLHSRHVLITGHIFLDRVLSRLVSDCFRQHKTVEVIVEDLVPGKERQELFLSLKGSLVDLQQLQRKMQDTCEGITGNCTYENLTKEEARKRREVSMSTQPAARKIPVNLPGANSHTHMVWTRVLPAVPNFLASADELPGIVDQAVIAVKGHLFNSGFVTVCSHMVAECPDLKFTIENIDLQITGDMTSLDFHLAGPGDPLDRVVKRIKDLADALPSKVKECKVARHQPRQNMDQPVSLL